MDGFVGIDEIPAELIKQGITFVAFWKEGLFRFGSPDSEAIKDVLDKIQPRLNATAAVRSTRQNRRRLLAIRATGL